VSWSLLHPFRGAHGHGHTLPRRSDGIGLVELMLAFMSNEVVEKEALCLDIGEMTRRSGDLPITVSTPPSPLPAFSFATFTRVSGVPIA
jgi:hypothetical protein